jgi:hypothetical protein
MMKITIVKKASNRKPTGICSGFVDALAPLDKK